MKILFSASVYRHLVAFHKPYIQYFLNQGHEVFAIAKDDGNKDQIENMGVTCLEIDIERSPFKIKNFKAYNQLKNILREHNFDLITTHTPFISFIIRIINANKSKLIYTAHGFHFYKNGNFLKNLLYKSMEMYAAKYTDELIVMNQEDYTNAKTFFKEENLHLINGIGVDLDLYNPRNIKDSSDIRNELDFDNNDILISYIGEMSKRKNQMYLLENWENIQLKCPQAKLLLIGNGELEKEYRKYVKSKNLGSVYFLGYRTDIKEIIYQSDIVTLLSVQEGLPRCILEAIALHKPIVVSDIRGNTDLVQNGFNGFTVNLASNNELVDKFISLIQNKKLQNRMGSNNKSLKEKYSEKTVLEQMDKIYNKVLNEEG
ncbi:MULTISPECIES: glycosyltransferase family 4 protein [Mammaliicoccus]|uniref:glycosyltransferase family 4 protein n=1 Tax=Mammaliicoccus TaxID=2803850 RepID=UPI001EFA9A6B|nr:MULTISPECIES: glycosyltransferase family 4 protein [Mammaliicoccus]MEB7806287.1 glycosyltransferase family 4 protein [Mammaliicoccus fleurettii]